MPLAIGQQADQSMWATGHTSMIADAGQAMTVPTVAFRVVADAWASG